MNKKSRMIRPSLTPGEHVIAHVFKVIHDPFVGKLAVFRLHQGSISNNTQLFVGEQRKSFKVGHLFRIHGKDHLEVPQGIPGDICAIAKVEEIGFNTILHNSHDEDHIHALPSDFPAPMLGVAITTRKHGDEQKLVDALGKIAAQDPCLIVEHDIQAHETVLRGMGELHLRIVIDLLNERYHLNVDTHPPAIAYRETITATAEGHHRHKKQSGGSGQFGEVYLRVEPLPRGVGFEFVNEVVGGSIPAQYIPAVEKGVRQALKDGTVAGYPIQDIRVSLHDGKFHAVDSNEVSFVSAGRKAFLEAVATAKPIVLEPIMNVEINTPQSHMGDVSGDLASRRGQISATRSSGSTIRISAKAPLAELQGYPSQLKSLTGGEGTFTMELGEYQPVPPNLQKKLIDDYRKKSVTAN
jgi:elongation factor G